MDDLEETMLRIFRNLEESQQSTISHSTLQDLQSILDTNGPDFFEAFSSQIAQSITLQSLASQLASTMDSATSIKLSLMSSKVYLTLLLSPNSPVFTLFTPMAFLSLLRSIRRALKPQQRQDNANASGSRRASNEKKRKNKKRKGRRTVEADNGDCEEEGDDGEFDIKEFFYVFEKLVIVLDLIHLDRFPDSLKSLIQTVVDVSVMGYEICGSPSSYKRLTDLCARVLSKLLRAEHGDQMITAGEVLKLLTPLILAANKSQSRGFALGFVMCSMMRMGEDENEGVRKAVVNLPRYLVQKAPEKSDPRGLAVEAIMDIVKKMQLDDQIRFIEYVAKMSKGKANLRLLAIDLILTLMISLRNPFGVESESNDSSWGVHCVKALIARCSDSVAAIRSRALSNLAQLVGFMSGDERNQLSLKEALGFDEQNGNSSEGETMNDLLRKRCMDEKAMVRKAALLLTTKLTALFGGSFDGVVLKTMGMSCSDPLISIRKAAVSALSEAFRTFSDELVTKEWLHSVPRLVADNETSIQEESEKLFLELVLDRISRVGSACENGAIPRGSSSKRKSLGTEIKSVFPEGVLLLLKEICSSEVMPWVKKICVNLGKKKQLKPKIAHALQNIIKTSESLWSSHSKPIERWTAPAGAWFLLSEVSAHLSKSVDWEFLHHHWELLDKDCTGKLQSSPMDVDGTLCEDEYSLQSESVGWAGDRVFLLQTISNVSVELPPEPAADLAHNLLTRIEEFNMHPTEVNAHVKALRTLCKRKASDTEEADTLVLKWVQKVLSKASDILQKFISENSEVNKEKSFLTPPTNKSKQGKQAIANSRLLSEAVTAVYTIGSLIIVCPSANITNVTPILHAIITSGNSDPKLNKLPGTSVSVKERAISLYIQAWLTMGKVCLADGKLAKRYIPLFVQELEKSDNAALRNNLVVMMTDFCVRYTALRDYVKWRGVLFLRFLLSLVDESDKIRQLADYLFGNILKVKAPLLAYNSFVEAVFVLNDCTAHMGHNIGSKESRAENRLFSIRGNDERSRSKRMHIYISLLKQMAPEHLLATFAKLCAEILAAASDGMLKIDDVTGQSVLQDAFQILSCKEIRLPTGRGSTADVADEEEGGDNAASAKGRAITHAVRKNLIQNTIPIFIELKRLLESKNSSLVGSLMECLRNLLKDYKNEIDDMLVADKQLQKELIYDMQKYEAAKARTTANEATCSNMKQNLNSFLSPNVSRNPTRDESRTTSKVASAMADQAAEVAARSVLREVNVGGPTPPLSAVKFPKLKSCEREWCHGEPSSRRSEVLESLRRRQSYSDDEN
ncbi:hypothetical protein ACFE04_013901 [Oxalis oulophora]